MKLKKKKKEMYYCILLHYNWQSNFNFTVLLLEDVRDGAAVAILNEIFTVFYI
jgi:hypothetical protein